MNCVHSRVLPAVVFALIAPTLLAGDEITVVLLDAHFDDKPLHQPIGTGGAAVGEPVDLSNGLNAIVRPVGDSPEPRLLELSSEKMPSARSATFEFLADSEVTSGQLHLSVQMTIPSDDFGTASIGIRPQGTSAFGFTNISFQNNRLITVQDPVGTAWASAGAFEFGQPVLVELMFDLDLGVYNLIIDGITRVSGRAHGIVERGVGRILFTLGRTATIHHGTMWVDQIMAAQVLRETIFEDGFELQK